MAVPYAYFRCDHCHEPIRFPFPNLEEKTECHPRLPKDNWLIHFLCRDCGHTSRRTAADVRLAHPHTEGLGPAQFRNDCFYRVEHKCGDGGCEARHVLYVHYRGYMTEGEALRRALGAVPRPFCDRGHPFHRDKTLVNVQEVFSLI